MSADRLFRLLFRRDGFWNALYLELDFVSKKIAFGNVTASLTLAGASCRRALSRFIVNVLPQYESGHSGTVSWSGLNAVNIFAYNGGM